MDPAILNSVQDQDHKKIKFMFWQRIEKQHGRSRIKSYDSYFVQHVTEFISMK